MKRTTRHLRPVEIPDVRSPGRVHPQQTQGHDHGRVRQVQAGPLRQAAPGLRLRRLLPGAAVRARHRGGGVRAQDDHARLQQLPGAGQRPARQAGGHGRHRAVGRRDHRLARPQRDPRPAPRAGAAPGPLPPARRRHLLHLRLHDQPGRHLQPGAAGRGGGGGPPGARQHRGRLPPLRRRGEAVPPQRRRRPGARPGELRRRRHAGGHRRGLLHGRRRRPPAPASCAPAASTGRGCSWTTPTAWACWASTGAAPPSTSTSRTRWT